MKMRDRKNFQWVNEREGKQDIVSQEIGRGGGGPSEDRSSMGRCREAGRPIKTKQKSAYLHKLA